MQSPRNSPNEPDQSALAVEDESDLASARPIWLKKRSAPASKTDEESPKSPPAKRKNPKRSKASGIKIDVVEDGEELPPWPVRIKRWVKSQAAKGCATSFGVHVLLLIVLSMFLMKGMEETEALTTRFALDDAEQTEFDEVDEPLDVAGMEMESIQSPQLQPVATPMPDFALPADLEKSISAISSMGDGELLNNSVGGFRMPSSGKVVRKGSFVAWTVPEDPAPLENYKIIIQIKLPRRIRNYGPNDISGFMTGTDGYETPIGFHRGSRGFRSGYYGDFNMQAKQLVIKIPGADANIRDTIEVESRVLRESQKLEIVF